MSDRRLRRPEDMMDPDTGLLPRERELITVLAALHQEYGVTSRFTHEAIAHVTGEAWPGSLAALVQKGYATRAHVDEGRGMAYSLSERGWALFVGVPEEIAMDGQGATALGGLEP